MKRSRLAFSLISLIAAVLILRGIYRAYFGRPVITIINRSPYHVNEIVLRGDPFVENVGQIPAGATQTIMVYPLGESGLMMEFVANGRRVAKDDLWYIERSGGYCITLEIDDQLEIRSIDSRFCFAIRLSV